MEIRSRLHSAQLPAVVRPPRPPAPRAEVAEGTKQQIEPVLQGELLQNRVGLDYGELLRQARSPSPVAPIPVPNTPLHRREAIEQYRAQAQQGRPPGFEAYA